MGVARVGAVVAALLALPATAAASDQCVNPDGTNGCHSSVQAAVDAASDGDTIRISVGRWVEAVHVPASKRLNFIGSGGNVGGGPESHTLIEPDNSEAVAGFDMPA